MRFALIRGGRVANIVEQDSTPTIPGQWVDVTGQAVGPGWQYDGANFTPPPATVYEKITTEAFWDRFTNNELVDYDVAMQHNPADTNNAKKDAARLRIFRRDAGEAGYRNLTKTKVRSFVQALETSGILAAGRAAVILDTSISDDEAYKA
jgi:hypothetical protein